jgi:hypothetical protein
MLPRRIAFILAAGLSLAGCEVLFNSQFNCKADSDCPLQSQGQRCVDNRCVGGSGDGSVGSDAGGVSDAGLPDGATGPANFPCLPSSLSLRCSTLQEIFFNQEVLSDVSVASLGGGFWLVAEAQGGNGVALIQVETSSSGTITTTDGGGLMSDVGNHGSPLITSTLVSPSAAPVMLAGYLPQCTVGNFTSTLGCWSPLSASVITSSAAPNVTYNKPCNEVDFVRASVDGTGVLGFVWLDLQYQADFLALGSSPGTCPSAGALTSISYSKGTPVGAAIQGLSSGFVVAEAALYNPTNELSIAILPGTAMGSASFGTGASAIVHVPAVAADGQVVTALTSDDGIGVQMFQAPQNNISALHGSTSPIFAPPVGGLAALACGTNCALTSWYTLPATGSPQAYYAAIDDQGCGISGVLGALTGAQATPFDTAIAYDHGTGTALIVVGYSNTASSNVMASFCK